MGEKLKGLFRGGFFHILGSTFINKIIAFLSNIGIVRILTKTDYGVFTGAFNVFLLCSCFPGWELPAASCISAPRTFPGRTGNPITPGP